jgi:hypothetical protein
MNTTSTVPQAWQDLLDLDPQLAGIDRVLADYRQRIRAGNQWLLYGRAKNLLSRYVGWDAANARAELQTSEAYQIGITHICDVLGI